MGTKHKPLFGGDLKWNANDWTASDDRSHLTPLPPTASNPPTHTALFHGHLDTTALGSAGFASQRTNTTTTIWDLAPYDGIRLFLEEGDAKTYTFIIKDELLEPDEGTGREKATVSWEVDFRVGEGKPVDEQDLGEGEVEVKGQVVFVPWRDFKPTYRGKEKKDVKAGIDLENVRRMSLMMRSFFGTQEGDFRLVLRSIEAVTIKKDEGDSAASESRMREKREAEDPDANSGSEDSIQKSSGRESQQRSDHSWLQWFWRRCWKL